MRILPIIVLLVCVAWEASARPQDDEPRAPNRGLLKRGPVGKGKTTTTTPAPAEEEGDYAEEGDYPAAAEAGQDASTEAPVSSTEGKKLVSGGVRPFRSNTDFLEALKRRRAQAAEAKQQGNSGSVAAQQTDSQPESPPKSSFSKKRFNSASSDNGEEAAPAPAKPARGRFSKQSSKSFQEPENEDHNDAAPPARSGRTFSRRGGQ